jgi:penicillin-binding protein 2
LSSPSTEPPARLPAARPRVEEPYRVTPAGRDPDRDPRRRRGDDLLRALLRLWALQVISGERYLEVAKNNQVRTFRAPAPRGSILDRNGDVLVSNSRARACSSGRPRFDQATPERSASSSTGSPPPRRPVPEIRPTSPPARTTSSRPITIKESVQEDKINYLLEHQNDFPGVQINQTYQRHYDQGGIAAQILGYVSEISQQQLDARKGRATPPATASARPGSRPPTTPISAACPGSARLRRRARPRDERAPVPAAPEAGDNVAHDRRRAAEDRRGRARYGIRLAHDDGKWAADGGALVAMDPNYGRDPRARVEPDLRPEHLHGPRRQEDLKQLADPSANHPTLDRAVAASIRRLDVQAGHRARRARDGLLSPTSSSSARRRRSSTARPSRTGTPTRTSP